jgi:hypothetical protein
LLTPAQLRGKGAAGQMLEKRIGDLILAGLTVLQLTHPF